MIVILQPPRLEWYITLTYPLFWADVIRKFYSQSLSWRNLWISHFTNLKCISLKVVTANEQLCEVISCTLVISQVRIIKPDSAGKYYRCVCQACFMMMRGECLLDMEDGHHGDAHWPQAQLWVQDVGEGLKEVGLMLHWLRLVLTWFTTPMGGIGRTSFLTITIISGSFRKS